MKRYSTAQLISAAIMLTPKTLNSKLPTGFGDLLVMVQPPTIRTIIEWNRETRNTKLIGSLDTQDLVCRGCSASSQRVAHSSKPPIANCRTEGFSGKFNSIFKYHYQVMLKIGGIKVGRDTWWFRASLHRQDLAAS